MSSSEDQQDETVIDLTHEESTTISESGNQVIESNEFSGESSSFSGFQDENHSSEEIVKLHKARNEYICQFCEKIFKGKPCLVKHEIMIHFCKPTCPDCGTNFTSLKHLENHFEEYTEKLYLECVKCAMNFSKEKNFRTHLDLNTCWIYFCEICGDLFQFHELKDHMRSHTGEDSYHCNSCGKEFSSETSVLEHMQTHNNENTLECDLCKRRFIKEAHFNKHVRGRSRYICTVCDRQFCTRWLYKRHVQSHDIEKRTCSICELIFSSTHMLEMHKKGKKHAYQSSTNNHKSSQHI
ncbi:zinc finger Y-chromosomal protein 2-like [Styela clava]